MSLVMVCFILEMYMAKKTHRKPQRLHPKPDPKEVKAGRRIPVGGKGGEEDEGFLLLGLFFFCGWG